MLELKHLEFKFRDKNIFQDLNMTFPEGAIIGIVGRNGVGKTTFFRVITGLYKALNGEINLNGRQLSKQEISFLPTDPFFYSYMNGAEYLELVVGGSKRSKAFEYAEQLMLPLDQLVDTYSTGMKKKLAFSAIISQNRPVQILDEPYNGVDLESNEIIKLILQHQKQRKSDSFILPYIKYLDGYL